MSVIVWIHLCLYVRLYVCLSSTLYVLNRHSFSQEHDEKPYEVTEEVFTKKRSDLIDVVEAHFKNGQTEVTVILNSSLYLKL